MVGHCFPEWLFPHSMLTKTESAWIFHPALFIWHLCHDIHDSLNRKAVPPVPSPISANPLPGGVVHMCWHPPRPCLNSWVNWQCRAAPCPWRWSAVWQGESRRAREEGKRGKWASLWGCHAKLKLVPECWHSVRIALTSMVKWGIQHCMPIWLIDWLIIFNRFEYLDIMFHIIIVCKEQCQKCSWPRVFVMCSANRYCRWIQI